MADTKLKVVLDAQDNASSKIAGLNTSFGKMASAVAVGTAAYDLLKKGMGLAIDVVKDSVTEFRKSEEMQERLIQILRTSTGASDAQIKTLINQAEALEKVGVVSDDVIIAAQGTLATFDLQTESIRKTIPAFLDMIVAEKGVGATTEDVIGFSNALGKIFQGDVGAMSKRGFVLGEMTEKIMKTGTETEKAEEFTRILSATYGGLNEKMRATASGGMAGLNNAIGDTKKMFGQAIMQGISPYIQSLSDSVTRSNDSLAATNSLGKGIYIAMGFIQGAANAVLVAGQSIAYAVVNIELFVAKIKAFFGGSQEKVIELKGTIDALKEDIGATGNKISDAFTRMTGEGFVPAKTALSDLNATGKNYVAGAADMAGATEGATKKLDEHKEAIEKNKEKIKEFKDDSIKAFQEVSASIRKDLIEETKKFEADRQAITEDTSSNIVDIIVKKQDEAAELTAEIQKADTEEQKAKYQERLDAINAFLLKHQGDIETNYAAIKVIRDNDLTDEINKIKWQAAEKLKELDIEHAAKIVKIKAQMDEVKKEYKDKFDEMYKELKKSKLFELFDDLENIGKKLMKKKKKTAFESSLAEFIGSIVGKQHGGTVAGGTPYLVGEQGPEVFVPSGGGRIIPNGQAGGAITVNFNNPTVRNDTDLRVLVDEVKRALTGDMHRLQIGA